jgi:PAS domain S-box-containing protein
MFLLVFVFSVFIRLPEIMPGWENSQLLQKINQWGPLPITAAILIAVLSALLNQKNFSKPFKVFLFLTAASIFMIVLPVPLSPQPELLYPIISMVTISASGYLVLRRRELPDLMFLLSAACFTLAEVGRGIMGSGIEFVVFAYTCAHLFLALVFVTAKENWGSGIASFFVLEKELEKTQKDLEISQDQLTKTEYQFKSLVNLIANPVVIVDHKGHFLEINDKIVELTGFSKEELLGKNFLKTDIVTMKSKAILIKNLTKRMLGITVKPYEIEAKTKSGDTLNFEVNAKKIEYEGKSADLVVFHDITERKIIEEKLEK